MSSNLADIVGNGEGGIGQTVDSVSSSAKVTEINKDRFDQLSESLVDTTNVAADTHYYPDANGFSMLGFIRLSFTGKIDDVDGTLTFTFEAMNDEDLASGDWIDITKKGYRADADLSGQSSITVTNGNIIFAFEYATLNYKYFRVKLIATGATNAVILKMRRSPI